jgi:ribosomal protein S18 acetylase RimI-like enzyme
MLITGLDGQVVGTVSIGGHGHQLPDSLRMFPLGVGAKFHRRGVGTALVEAVEEIPHRQEFQTIALEVGVENDGALRMYVQLGYLRLSNPELVR